MSTSKKYISSLSRFETSPLLLELLQDHAMLVESWRVHVSASSYARQLRRVPSTSTGTRMFSVRRSRRLQKREKEEFWWSLKLVRSVTGYSTESYVIITKSLQSNSLVQVIAHNSRSKTMNLHPHHRRKWMMCDWEKKGQNMNSFSAWTLRWRWNKQNCLKHNIHHGWQARNVRIHERSLPREDVC